MARSRRDRHAPMVDQRKGDAVNIQILRRGGQWLKLRDILTWKWQGNSAITFELQRSRSPVYRRAVSVLCKAMVCNYSELFLEPSLLTRLKPISAGTPAHLSWHLSDTADSIIFYDGKLSVQPARSSRVTTANDEPVRTSTTRTLVFMIIRRCRASCSCTGVGVWRPNRSQYKKSAAMTCEAQGKLERDRAILVQAANNIELQGAFVQLGWSDIRAVTGGGATTIQTLFRLKTNKLNLWNYVHSDWSCPHEAFCLSSTRRHARGWRSVIVLKRSLMPIKTFEVSSALWRLTAASTIHAIWCARLRLRHEPDALQSTLRAVVSTTVDNALRDFVYLSSEFDTDVSSFPKKAVTGALAARLTEHTEE
uniref:Uncharacterized protein n=1 Tax=Hyaloperonospora arabidopsidis (strain Emoy2) TaxID=559515 RepID=M4B7Y6_HYAAE